MAPLDFKDIEGLIEPYRVSDGASFDLARFDPADTQQMASEDKAEAKKLMRQSVEWIAEQQTMLAAQRQWAVLIVLQARDAAGKDSTIRHVMTGLNPQGCHVTSFKEPSSVDLSHDYLWRYHNAIPARGEIGIFNRSHYEEVLVVRVHDELLSAQGIPPSLVSKKIWSDRLEDIVNFEQYLVKNGVAVVKFFLNVSREEQKERLLERLDEPEKHWKFSSRDVEARAFWDDYTCAYQEAISATSTKAAPWYIVPADKKWFTRLIVANVVASTIAKLDVSYPEPDSDAMNGFAAARRLLLDD